MRILPERGAPYSLPPGVVLDELPARYEGKLTAIELDDLPKREHGYSDKMIRPSEDK